MGNSSKRAKLQTKEQPQKQSLSVRITGKNLGLQGREFKQLGQMLFQRLPEDFASLSLHQCNIGDQGCKILAKARWPQLKNLIITQNKVGDKGIAILVKADMPRLKNLNISGNFLRDLSCKTVTKGNWKEIQNITFNETGQQKRINKITKLGINYLQQLNLKNLAQIRKVLQKHSFVYFEPLDQYDYL